MMEPIRPERIEGGCGIAGDPEFLYELQRAALLALAEAGRLTDAQYRYAEEALRRQRDQKLLTAYPQEAPETETKQ